MVLIGDINRFPHELNFVDFGSKLSYTERQELVRSIMNDLFGDNIADYSYKVNAFILANYYFLQATESYIYTQYNAAMVMLRNAIEAALWFAYCYEPIYKDSNAEPIGYSPNENYTKYTKDNWTLDGMRDAIHKLDLNPIFNSGSSAEYEINSIRDKGNFSAHLAQRQSRAFKEFSEMNDQQRRNNGYHIKTTAEEEDTRYTILQTAKYLIYIREQYFKKYQHS